MRTIPFIFSERYIIGLHDMRNNWAEEVVIESYSPSTGPRAHSDN